MKTILIIAILAIGLISSPAVADREFSYDKSDEFEGDQVSKIKIDMPKGLIELTKSKSSRIEIDFKNMIHAKNQNEADDINDECSYRAEVSGDVLSITIDLPRYTERKGILKRLLSGDWENDIESYLRVRIPDGKNIEVKSSSADIEVSELTANLDVRSSSTDVTMKNTAGEVSFDLSSGDLDIVNHKGDVKFRGNSSDVDLTDIEGRLDIETSSGDGSLDNIKGLTSIYASSGDYRLYNIDGDLDAHTSSGDIYASGITGSIRAETSSGDIRLKGLASRDGDFDIESSSGDVILEVTEDFQGTISLRSTSGSVDSRLSGKLEYLSETSARGKIGDGEGRLRVSTISGDISIDRF
jgi:hypothetical protein